MNVSIAMTVAFLLASAIVAESNASTTQVCRSAFEGETRVLSRSDLHSRVSQVVAHQNQLRRKAGLSEVALELKNNPENIKLSGLDPKVELSIRDEGPIEAAPIFLAADETIVRDVPNDLFALNFVYKFSKGKLSKATPLAVWLLEHTSSPTVRLTREMSPQEFELWRSGAYASLGADWGHVLDGQATRVVHFSTNAKLTTAAFRPGDISMTLGISKNQLLRWAKAGQVWAARIGDVDAKQVHEFVLSAELLKAHPTAFAGWKVN